MSDDAAGKKTPQIPQWLWGIIAVTGTAGAGAGGLSIGDTTDHSGFVTVTQYEALRQVSEAHAAKAGHATVLARVDSIEKDVDKIDENLKTYGLNQAAICQAVGAQCGR
ncbi:MAG: hypothetical protein CMB99_01475 [Flavobacteriaceae bacterium]|nr:hypothetical protein [Flavobacteriaceae bacterium]|tara:strand:- start:502 stop:828 length:327 start_codon:yes stop_codon:yes gene_type:complete